ncbi:MAG: AAA family ATPase [Actinomycetota bacterium]
MDGGIDDAALRRFLTGFQQVAEAAAQSVHDGEGVRIAEAVSAHLGVDAGDLPLVGENVAPVDRVNLQLALDALVADQPDHVVLGLSPELAHFSSFSASALLGGRFHGPATAVPLSFEELPAGVDRTVRCARCGVWLLRSDDAPVAVLLVPNERHGPPGSASIRVEVIAADLAVAEATLADLGRLRWELNVYRGAMLAFTHSEYGDFGISFVTRPTTSRDEVILPEGHLDSIERHTIGVAERAEQLTAAGRHLRRGLLLHGPPGTGKTLTVGYLAAAMPERTVILLQGPSIGALGQAAAIVHALTPSMLVIEDVDLIAGARGMPGMDTNPLLFELLNLMDGLAPDADVVFVLTTNRVDLLEPALAARPGRIDHAVEIERPDGEGRDRLLRLYLDGVDHRVTDTTAVVELTDGVTASFIKELVRRAVMGALDDGGAVTDAHLAAAGAALLDASSPVLRAMLGAAGDADEADAPPAAGPSGFGYAAGPRVYRRW